MPIVCSECRGSKNAIVQVDVDLDEELEYEDCPGCAGTGYIVCAWCGGPAIDEHKRDGWLCDECFALPDEDQLEASK
jgi:DnaJ-class molecular chaperone